MVCKIESSWFTEMQILFKSREIKKKEKKSRQRQRSLCEDTGELHKNFQILLSKSFQLKICSAICSVSFLAFEQIGNN